MGNICEETLKILLSYEKKYDTIMTPEQIEEVKKAFDLLTESQKSKLDVYFITMGSDTYGPGTYLTKCSGTIRQLQQFFEKGYTVI